MSGHLTTIANHLWQSTLFVAAVWLVTLLLRGNRAKLRYTLWLTASMKFLLPFSLLVALGGLLPKPSQAVLQTQPALYSAVDIVSQPFLDLSQAASVAPAASLWERLAALLPIMLAAIWLCGTAIVLLVWFARWRQVAQTLRRAEPAHSGREIHILRQVDGRLPLMKTQELMEPGIFGVLRPVLLWPERLSAHLDDEHIEAILLHELMHVWRRDNLTAALHMLVEAIFWFHPIVWWMERRMIEERERACDEAVIQMGGSAEAYAESLVKACRFCVESPLTCVSGITGADLNQRIVAIMRHKLGGRLGLGKAALLAVVGIAIITAPLLFGQVSTTLRAAILAPLQAPAPPPPPPPPILPQGKILHATGSLPSFEVVSIRPWRRPQLPPPPSGEKIISQRVMKFSPGRGGGQTSDRVHMIMPIEPLIAVAYNLPLSSKRILGIPDWAKQDIDQYEIQAKIEESQFAAMQKMTPAQQHEQVALMEQSLLANRFKLKVHFETREMPGYALVLAKSGPKLTPAKDGEANQLTALDGEQPGTVMTAKAVTLEQLVHSPLFFGGALIVDQTGLKGAYDFTLNFQRDQLAASDAGQNGPDVPSLFTAIQEQLGLKLVPTKAPVEVLIVDSIEKPSEN